MKEKREEKNRKKNKKTNIEKSGLTDLGKKVIGEMNRLNMLVDVSHINEKGFWDILDKSDENVFASHSNAYTVCKSLRNLKDEQLKAIKEKNGVIGVTYHGPFVTEKSVIGDLVNLYEEDELLRQIDYIMNKVSEHNICLGSDFDGSNYIPPWVNSINKNKSLYDRLIKIYNKDIADKIFYKNMLSFIKN